MSPPLSASPALVLDDTCVVKRDLGNFVMGEVKNFSSINNIHILLANEGFPNAKVVYLGGMWVMLELPSLSSKDNIMKHVGVASWFHCLTNAEPEFVSRERIVWVDIEGVPLHVWSCNTFTKIGSKWGEVLELEENKDDFFARKRVCIKTKQEDNILEKFKIIVNRKVFVIRARNCCFGLVLLWRLLRCGYVPRIVFVRAKEEIARRNLVKNEFGGVRVEMEDRSILFGDNYWKGRLTSSRISENSQKVDDHLIPVKLGKDQTHKEGGSILEVLEEVIKVGHTMGFSMEGVHKDMEKIIGSQGDQMETKMDIISDMEVKYLWGNLNFDFIFSEALGFSGGILCVWDNNMFRKEQHIISDNFVALYGTWSSNKMKILLISVYAPQVGSYKKRGGAMGSSFNMESAQKYAQIGSLLLVSLNGINLIFSHAFSAVCLDKHLSDHRPILLREVYSDFGAIPFRFYQSWLSIQGFEQLVSHTWNTTCLNDSNGMIRFKKKLQILKKEIHQGGVNDDILAARIGSMHFLSTQRGRSSRPMPRIIHVIHGHKTRSSAAFPSNYEFHHQEIEMCTGMFKDQAEVVVAQEEVQEKIDLVENEEELIEEEE
ncbi:RNA-directed DNA polymerase, eukaryota [Tanacetum coccineum]